MLRTSSSTARWVSGTSSSTLTRTRCLRPRSRRKAPISQGTTRSRTSTRRKEVTGSLLGGGGAGGLRPAEMLAAVEGDHLPGQRRRRQDEPHGRSDFLRAGAAPQRQLAALPLELLR